MSAIPSSALRNLGFSMLVTIAAAVAPAFSQTTPATTPQSSPTAPQQSQDGWKHFNGGWSNQTATTPRATESPAPNASTASPAEQNSDPNTQSAPADQSQNAPPAAPATPPVNPPAPGPQASPTPWQLTVPSGTYLTVRLNEPLSSDRNQEGDTFTATLAQPVITQGVVVAQRGQTVGGRVVEAKKAGRVSGVSRLRLELTGLTLADGQYVPIQSQLIRLNGPTSVGRDVSAVAGTTALGAAVGAAAAWGTGAAIGAGAGLVASTIGVLVTRGRPTILYPETQLTFQVTAPINVDTERAPQAFRVASEEDYPQNTATANYPQGAPNCGPYGCPPPAYPYSYPYPYYSYYSPYYYPYPYFWGPSFGFYYGRGFYGRGFYGRGYYGGFRGGFHR